MFLLACRNVAGQRVKVISSNFCCSINPSQVQILSPKCERWWKSKHQEDALHQPWGALPHLRHLLSDVESWSTGYPDHLHCSALSALRVECWRLIWTSSCLLHRQPALVGRGNLGNARKKTVFLWGVPLVCKSNGICFQGRLIGYDSGKWGWTKFLAHEVILARRNWWI